MKKTNELVIKLSQNMVCMQPLLEQSVKEAEELSIRLERDKYEAGKSKAKVEEEKKLVDRQTAEV